MDAPTIHTPQFQAPCSISLRCAVPVIVNAQQTQTGKRTPLTLATRARSHARSRFAALYPSMRSKPYAMTPPMSETTHQLLTETIDERASMSETTRMMKSPDFLNPMMQRYSPRRRCLLHHMTLREKIACPFVTALSFRALSN